MTVDMGPPELNGPKVPSTLPTNADGVVLKEPIQVGPSRILANPRMLGSAAQPLGVARVVVDPLMLLVWDDARLFSSSSRCYILLYFSRFVVRDG